MDRDGRQELHYRALEGDVPGIRQRLAAGDQVALADNEGFTALHFAAQESRTEAAKALLDEGAPVDPQDRYGNTPLWRAVFTLGGRWPLWSSFSTQAPIRTSETRRERRHVNSLTVLKR